MIASFSERDVSSDVALREKRNARRRRTRYRRASSVKERFELETLAAVIL